ncbi:uncharacterized protein LOC110994715 [Pieris rapae]|uniref:uncharacterized protein LOC110994715 n=1 Tax=Pieris rapae TaxID=64459 RepID=UPI001E27B2C8|nr:uncharacterized protein LOC110994715 [Pieris rapae]
MEIPSGVVLLLFIACVGASTDTPEPMASILPANCITKAHKKVDHIEECTKESRVNKVQIEKMKSGYWSLPHRSTSLKYWAFCYLKRLNMMTEAGVLRQDVVLKNFNGKERLQITKIIDKCLYTTAHLPMDTAWHYLSCFHKNNYKLCKRVHGI